MNVSILFIRSFFSLICMVFVGVYTVHTYNTFGSLIIGLVIGFGFSIFLIGLDYWFKRFNLRSFNVAILGLFIGYLMGQALVLILHAILKIVYVVNFHTSLIEIIEISFFLFGTYLGLVLTMRASDELYVSIPFVKFTTVKEKKRDLIIDHSALSDSRIIDLSLSGLLDFHLIIPRFVIRDLYAQADSSDEGLKYKAKKALDTLKKLEEEPALGLRYNDTDFPEVKESSFKITRLARLIDANILTADISNTQMPDSEGVKVINIHSLSSALKPLTQTGEIIRVKMQRHGKEADQGVGYLEDGTMIVVNGGGEHIGKEIEANVLSVKHTSSGRMIFCNVSRVIDE